MESGIKWKFSSKVQVPPNCTSVQHLSKCTLLNKMKLICLLIILFPLLLSYTNESHISGDTLHTPSIYIFTSVLYNATPLFPVQLTITPALIPVTAIQSSSPDNILEVKCSKFDIFTILYLISCHNLSRRMRRNTRQLNGNYLGISEASAPGIHIF